MADAESTTWSRRHMPVIKTLLSIAFIAAGLFYVAGRLTEFRELSWPSAGAVIAVILGFIASVLFRALYNLFTGRRLGANLSLRESFMLSAVVTASNVILPANPGATFRAVYMKNVHAFPYSYFASSAVLYFVITLLMMSTIGIVLLVLMSLQLNYFRLDLFLALPAIILVALLSLSLRHRSNAEKRGNLWSSFKNGYIDLVRDPKLVYISLLVVASNYVVASIVWVIALTDYAPDVALLEAFLFAASQIAGGLINLTPGAAGFQELIGVYVGRSFPISAVELFAVLVWVRLVRTVSAIVLGIPCAIGLRFRSSS